MPDRLACAHLTMPPDRDARRGDPVYFLLHIPKTAGQTIQVHLAEHCAPGTFWQSQRRVRIGRGERSADLPDPERARVVCGHHIGQSLEQLFPGRPVRRIVLLRDPLELQISLYNWQMMDSLAKGLGTYGFALHLRALPRNFIAHFLLSRWLEIPWPRLMTMGDADKYRLLDRMLAGFWFVGAHTDCDRLLSALAPDLGVPPLTRRRNTSAELRGQTGWRLLRAEALSPAMRASIGGHNRLDQAIWEDWRGAGFETAVNRAPRPMPNRKTSFLAHELVRPLSLAVRSVLLQGWRRRNGEPAAARLSRANQARNAAAWEDAARYYLDALQVLPNAPAIWVQYGHALKESGRVAEAEQAYRRSISLDPGIADSHLQLGHALSLQGRLDQAIEAYLNSARLAAAPSPAHDVLVGLGWTMEHIDRITRHSAQPVWGESEPGSTPLTDARSK